LSTKYIYVYFHKKAADTFAIKFKLFYSICDLDNSVSNNRHHVIHFYVTVDKIDSSQTFYSGLQTLL